MKQFISRLLKNEATKDALLVLMVFVSAGWWCYSIVALMFFPNAVALMGIFFGAACFLMGMDLIKERA